MRSTTLRLFLGLALGCALGSHLAGATAAQTAPETAGFLYGTVIARDGTEYEGRLRWGEQEAFWSDLFNGSKSERPWLEEIPSDRRSQPAKINLFGFDISLDDHDSGRRLAARYGDIDEIEVTGRNAAVLVMKAGRRVAVEGGSNDLGGNAKITVWDAKRGRTELAWRDIERIRFRAAPPDLPVDAHRLFGVVHTGEGDFHGWIQWDQDECLSTDELDGETRDGELAIPMGDIRKIERGGRRSSRVTLEDGRELTLEGSNDVNSANRGIFVEDERFGRVLVSWDAFERADFSDPPGSGPAYGSFEAGKQLRGTVTIRGGRKLTGRLIYDMDEEETWETLDGERHGIDYMIPLSMIASVTPEGSEGSRIELTNGEVVELEGTADVGEGNAGVLVLAEGKRPVYVAWEEVRRIELGR